MVGYPKITIVFLILISNISLSAMQNQVCSAVATSEGKQASSCKLPTPREFIDTIESVNIPQNLNPQATIPCTTSDKQLIYIPRSIVYLFPTLNDAINMLGQDKIDLTLIDSVTLNQILTIAWQLRELLTVMTYYTKKTYTISKTYAPDDIPLTIRIIIAKLVDNISGKTTSSDDSYLAKMIEAANFLQASWLINPLAAEWAIRKQYPSKEEEKLISQDVRDKYIKKYRKYLYEASIYSEFSVADLAFFYIHGTLKELGNIKLFKRYGEYIINFIEDSMKMKELLPWPLSGKHRLLLTSLTGFEFFNAYELSKIRTISLNIESLKLHPYKELGLSGIHTLKPYTFLGCKNVQKINLITLGIKKIDLNAFASLQQLSDIVLDNNETDLLTTDHQRFRNEISHQDCERIKQEVGQKVTLQCPKPFKIDSQKTD